MNRFFSLLLITVMVILTSCEHSFKKNEVNVATDLEAVYRNGLTHTDSIAARALVENFMNAVQNGKYADAIANLYALNKENPYKKPELLDNAELQNMMDMMQKFNVQFYRIQSMEFVSAVNNPAKCAIDVQMAGGNETIKLTWVLNPINYMGKWLLCFAAR